MASLLIRVILIVLATYTPLGYLTRAAEKLTFKAYRALPLGDTREHFENLHLYFCYING